MSVGARAGSVLHLSASVAYGGGEEHLRVLLSGLARLGWDVALACPPASPVRERLAGAGVAFRDWGPFAPADPRAARALLGLLARAPANLVHSHNPLEDVTAAAARVARPGLAAVTTVHDRPAMDGAGRRRRDLNAHLYRWVLRMGFDRVIAVSRATRNDVVAFAGVSPHRVRAVANGIDLARLARAPDRAQARARLGVPEEAVVFGMGARVETLSHRKKGVDVFLAAAARILPARPEAQAWIVGLGPRAEAEVRARLAAAAWGGRVTLRPFLRDFPDVLAAWDVAVLPSLYEGLPRSVVEAMAMGLPVVASAVDGVMEAVPPEAGLLVPPGDPDALAEAIAPLLTDPARRARMGAAGRARAIGAYGADRLARDVAAVYREVLA